jgi:hypothetical protein
LAVVKAATESFVAVTVRPVLAVRGMSRVPWIFVAAVPV